MVQRALTKDDSRGVGEPLNETQFTTSYAAPNGGAHYGPALIVRGQHWVSLEPPATAASVWRPLQDRLYARPVLAFTPTASGVPVVPRFSAVAAALPPNVMLMTLHSLAPNQVLLRLAHQFGVGEDAVLSQPVQACFVLL